ncbi:hypothetical protein LZ30DRAFT_589219 [Colletotrichum cereale]|nr:hypothetical protein LZ30DRAFT_589219 [Colletotrichum cereale]
MTPQNCAVLAPGRRYIGIYADICYASDTLEATSYTELAQCSLFCPGDNTQFCGGNANPNLASIRPRQRHSRQLLKRDAPPNIFLTLYEFATGLPNTTIVGPGTIAVGPSATALGSSTVVTGSDRVGVPRSSGGTRAAITTVVSGITLTITSVVTTVSYMTVDSENPTALISAELCTTLYYHDCGCSTQITPRVPMTTISVDCNACGYQEANHIALTVPGKLNGFDLFKAISTSSEGFSQLGQVSTFVPGASASLPTAVSSNFKNTLFEPEGGSNSAKTSILGLIVSTALGNVVPISSSSTEVSQLSVSQQTNAPVETQIKASASVGWNGGLSTTKPSSVTVAGTKGMGDKSRTAYLYSIALCASLIVNFLL